MTIAPTAPGFGHLLACAALLVSACSQATPPAAAAPTGAPAGGANPVMVNGQAVDAQALHQLQQAYGITLPPGQYWYDARSGAAGPDGGPTAGFILPGLPLGGALRADASRGNTGVYVNGRQLPPQDLQQLVRLVGPIMPGHYFLDGNGNAGLEGGPPLVNLIAAARQGAGRSGGGGDGWYSGNTGAYGNESGGAGYVTTKDASGNMTSSYYER